MTVIRLGHPEVLRDIYGRVLVPAAILMELSIKGNFSNPKLSIQQ